MYKKLLIVSALLIAIVFSFSTCFANTAQDISNGVKNAVDNTKNAVENAGKGISDTSKNITGAIENGANNMANNTMNNINNNVKTNMNNGNTFARTNGVTGTNRYTATRTAAGGATFMGMTATTWTWLILGIAAIAIVGMVWYYSMQTRSSHYDNRD